jgi:hypothetical protein
MELYNVKEFEDYIRRNYDLLGELSKPDYDSELPDTCDACHKEAFLKIHSESYQRAYYNELKVPRFVTFFIECPQCRRKSFIKTVQLEVDKPIIVKDDDGNDEEDYEKVYQFYKLFRLPIIEETYANKDIPAQYTSLKDTVSEASFCLSHSRNIAAAILFRRALQILSKDILGAQGRTLYLQLEWLKTNKNLLSIELAAVFHENAKILKDIGNQGAHPDDDITLHNFTKKDADGLHDLFISIVYEVFVKPAKLKALQEELKQSRKLK